MGKEAKNDTKAKLNLVDVAKKKRQLYLYGKLHGGKSLTPSEIKELEKLEGQDLPNGVVDTKEKIAKALKVSIRTVYYWEKEGMPVTPEGNYDLLEIKAWRMTKNILKDQADSEKDKWETEYRKNKALLAELEYKKALGQLLPRDEVERAQVAKVIALKRSFLTLPVRLAPLLAMKEPREIHATLKEAINEIIDEFAGVRRDEDEDNSSADEREN